LNVVQDKTEVTRRGFVTNYPLFRHWRKEAADEGLRAPSLNIYVHTPYCIQRCAYCHYKTTTLRENQLRQIDHYIDTLCREIELAAARFHLADRLVTTLYFGGGTPTLLSGENIDKIFTTLRRNLNLVEHPEITFEGEPVTLTARKAEILQRHGVNRLSIGIQSFKDEIVFKTGREDTEQQALKSIEIALGTGASVNIDLISGLAGESLDTWAYSVERALATGVHSITVYKLEVYANTEYYHGVRREDLSLPDDETEMAMMRYALSEFERAGYAPVNFFTFTQDPRHAQRHTTSKWKGDDIYAFGVSAFGALGPWAYQNTNELDGYLRSVEAGELPIFRGYVYSSLDLMARDVILGMKLIHYSHREFRRRYGLDLLRLCRDAITGLEREDFITVDEESIHLTRKGILYGDHVGRVLAAALEELGGAS
jgi:oxygen-independent coproporphyrinogen-3 oxidase